MMRTTTPPLLGALAALLLLAGCSGRGGAPVQTDETTYSITSGEVAISATYTNHGSDTLYLGYCGKTPPRYTVERNHDDGWRSAYEPICLALLVTTPFPVAPGQSHTDLLKLRNDDDVEPRFQGGTIGGDYRLVYTIYSTWNPETGGGELLPIEQRISNTFTITE